MKMKKKIWALLLSAVMIVTYLPAMAFADDTVNDNGDAAENELADVAEPVSAFYEGAALRGVVGTNRILSLEDPAHNGNAFVVQFSDGTEKVFRVPESFDESAETYPEGAFVYDEDTYLFAEIDDSAGDVSFTEGWNYGVRLQLAVHYGSGDDEAVSSVPVTADVICAYDNMPLSVRFVPAEGFELESYAGPNFLDDTLFYGEGNCFEVDCRGWAEGDSDKGIEEGYIEYTRKYQYVKGVDDSGEEVEGFFLNGRLNYIESGYIVSEDCDLEYGKDNEIEFTYMEYIDALDEWVEVPFTVTVKATKYNPYAKDDGKIYAYTGSTRKLSFKMYDNDGKLIPSTEYTISPKNAAKKMGWYDATITFKNKDKYVDSVPVYYGIGPASPKLTKLTAGKKSLTVRWKKLSAKQLKTIDGFYIKLSTDKHFYNNVKTVKVTKKAFKSGKKLVKGLKKGKRYYVKMYAYKSIKRNGITFKMRSADSKIMYRKTK